MKTLLHSGRVKCIYEPRGDYGLEGYQLDQFYDYEMFEKDGKKYARVYPDKLFPSYFECCSFYHFNTVFEISGKGE